MTMSLKLRILSVFTLSFLLFSFFAPITVFAAITILPETRIEKTVDCQRLMNELSFHLDKIKQDVFLTRGTYLYGPAELNSSDFLGCGIKTGDISLWMVPYYVRFLLEFVLGLSGLIAVAGIVYGGFLYLFAGISDEKEKGKKAILFGIMGFVITMLAFAFVNIVMALVTG